MDQSETAAVERRRRVGGGEMKVRDVMTHTIRCANLNSTIQDVARMMKQEDTGFIPVVDSGRLIGAVTDRDIVLRCLAEGHENPLLESIEHVMSTDIVTITPDEDLYQAGQTMGVAEVRRLPVVENGRLVGVLSHGNLVQATQGRGPAEQATVGVTEGA